MVVVNAPRVFSLVWKVSEVSERLRNLQTALANHTQRLYSRLYSRRYAQFVGPLLDKRVREKFIVRGKVANGLF